jgi:hypothetical protein
MKVQNEAQGLLDYSVIAGVASAKLLLRPGFEPGTLENMEHISMQWVWSCIVGRSGGPGRTEVRDCLVFQPFHSARRYGVAKWTTLSLPVKFSSFIRSFFWRYYLDGKLVSLPCFCCNYFPKHCWILLQCCQHYPLEFKTCFLLFLWVNISLWVLGLSLFVGVDSCCLM